MEENRNRITGGMLTIPYISPTPGRISIVAKAGFSHKAAVSDNEFKLLKECGFNVMTCSMTEGDRSIEKTLNNAYDVGIKVLLNNKQLEQGMKICQSFVSRNRNYPALGGWNLIDEPSYSDLTARGCVTVSENEESCSLYESVQQILEKDRAHMVYINLPAGGHWLEGHTLDEYLDAYGKGFKTGLWSYDMYPISETRCLLREDPSSCPAGGDGVMSVNYSFFYRCLETFSKRARDSGSAFWAYCQCMSYVNGNTYRPLALEQYLRFEAFSALAYGAQGIVYWRYKRDSNGNELYLSAPLGLSGQKTAVWYYAQKVNKEIERYNSVFADPTSVKVYHIGEDKYPGAEPWRGEAWTLGDILAYGGNGVIVSFITNAGGSFIVVVSRDVLNYQRVSMLFCPGCRIREITPLTSTGRAPAGLIPVSPEKVERTLNPGGYLIYKVEGSAASSGAGEEQEAGLDSVAPCDAEADEGAPGPARLRRAFATPKNAAYANPTLGSVSIVATTPNEGDSAPSAELCREMSECGFNSALMTVKLSEVSLALANCGASGIRPLMHHSHLTRSEAACADFVERYKDNTSLGGWYLWGQPAYGELSGEGDLKKYYSLIKEKDSGRHAIFVSLVGGPVPRYMEGEDGRIHTYKEYIERFQEALQPSFWPYVLYPVYRQGDSLSIQYDAFFRDLEVYSLMRSYTERPFWAYVRSQAFRNATTDAPAPTEAHMRFAAFSALAYGAQGIVYWTYRQRPPKPGESYSDAPVDLSGARTPVWGYVRRVNEEIRLLNPVFYESELVECRHTGKTIYSYTARLTHPMPPLASLSSGDPGVLVSHLNTHGADYLVIVSHDLVNSQVLGLEFCPYWQVWELVVTRSGTPALSRLAVKTGTVIKRILPPGGYLLFHWV